MSGLQRSAALVLTVAVVGCGRTDLVDFDELTPIPPSDSGVVLDAGRDAGARDAGARDAGRDAGVDAGGDAGFDAGQDAGFDAGFDGGRDAGLRDAGPADAGRLDAGVRDAGVQDAGPPEVGLAQDLIYLHSGNTLFSYAPSTNTLARIATLSCGGALDLAIDRQGRGYIVAGSDLFRVNLQTGACSRVATLPEPLVALSFLPAGLLGTEESLVGYGQMAYWEFDPFDGSAVMLGSSGLFGGLVPSGDLSPFDDGGTWLTVRSPSLPNALDQLVRINPETGAVLQNFGPMGVSGAWGLATWNGTLFAFTSGGQGVRLSFVDGGVQPALLSLGAGMRTFWGAAARPGAGTRADAGP